MEPPWLLKVCLKRSNYINIWHKLVYLAVTPSKNDVGKKCPPAPSCLVGRQHSESCRQQGIIREVWQGKTGCLAANSWGFVTIGPKLQQTGLCCPINRKENPGATAKSQLTAGEQGAAVSPTLIGPGSELWRLWSNQRPSLTGNFCPCQCSAVWRGVLGCVAPRLWNTSWRCGAVQLQVKGHQERQNFLCF